MITREQLVREFSQALDDGDAALFAGAGLSVGAKLVDWRGLLRSVAHDLDLDIDEEHDLIAVAQYEVNKSRSRYRLNKAILEEFSKHVEASNNHRLIAQMPFEVIWTTNYDSLIEDSLKAGGRRVDVKGVVKKLALHTRRAEVTVYKMHGDVSNPDDAVLTKDDYENYEFERSAFTDLLRSDLTRYTFLFLGFSFTDPNIEYVLARLRRMLHGVQKHHFCILRRPAEPDDPGKKSQHARELAKFAHRVEDLKRFGIQTHVISDFQELEEILATLRNKCALKNVMVSGSAHDFSPLGRERLEEFARKLGHQLIERGFNLVSGFGLNIGGACILGAYEAAQVGSVRSISDRLLLRPFPQHLPPDRTEAVFARVRRDLMEHTGAIIFLAGNKLYPGETSPRVAEGVMREFEMAKASRRVMIPVPSTGHAAAVIWAAMKPNLTELFPDPSVDANFAVLEDGARTDEAMIDAIFAILAKSTKPTQAQSA